VEEWAASAAEEEVLVGAVPPAAGKLMIRSEILVINGKSKK
jgi:hypothetical protein